MSGTPGLALPKLRPALSRTDTAVALLVALGLVGLLLALVADVPEAWSWIAVTALATIPVVVWFAANGRLFEPLPLLAADCALLFLTRPIQLLLEWRDLYSGFQSPDPIQRIVLLETQEIANYVTTRLEIPLGVALARASGLAAIFVVAMLVGYRLGVGRWLAARLERVRGGGAPRNPVAAVATALGIGFAAQLAIVVRAGGPAASLETANEQNALSDSFVLFFLAGFGLVALVVWVAWRSPQSRSEWVALVFAIAAICGFAMIAGSRTRVFVTLLVLAFIVHYVHRRWRWRELVAVGLLLLAFASSFGVFRQVADDHSLGTAARLASEHVLDGRVILNDTTSYDHLIYATTIYGQPGWIEQARPHEHGQFLLDGALAYVPSALYADKPDVGDVEFRRVVWGDDYGAGRPPTAAGDFFIDFGLPGVAVGALLIGIAARALVGLIGGGSEGHRYRVTLFAVLTFVLYEFVEGTFAIALGFAITMLIPLLITVHGFGRLPWPVSRQGAA